MSQAPRQSIGATGFEPAISYSRSTRDTKLRYAPTNREGDSQRRVRILLTRGAPTRERT